jgi:hypothetical protein
LSTQKPFCAGKCKNQIESGQENLPVRLTPLSWGAGLNPPLQKGEAVGMPRLIEMLLTLT